MLKAGWKYSIGFGVAREEGAGPPAEPLRARAILLPMMPFGVRRGRQRALLLFVFALVIAVVTLVGVARADVSEALQTSVDPQTASVTVSAKDLGGFQAGPPAITSPSAVVINSRTGEILYEKGSRLQRPMASTTKIMTAVVVLETMDLKKQVTMSQNAAQTWEKAWWVDAGDVLTVEQLLYGLMVQSENQAAVALAEGCAGSVEAFVQMMNAKAVELGLRGTRFTNPSGLDAPGHYSTAADLATLAQYAMNSEVIGESFRKLVQTKQYTTQIRGNDQPTVFTTTNELMLQNDWVAGVKTGDTVGAGICLVAAGTRDGVSMISVVLGAVDHATCFGESKSLLEYGMSQNRYVTLLEQEVPVAEALLPYHVDEKLQLVPETEVGAELSRDDTVTASVTIDKQLVLPVTAGDVFGRVELSVDGVVVGTVDVVAAESAGETTLGTKLVYYLTRFGRWVKG